MKRIGLRVHTQFTRSVLQHRAPLNGSHPWKLFALEQQQRGFATEFLTIDEEKRNVSNRIGLSSMDVQNRDFVLLKWSDGRSSRFHFIHLRAWCLCPSCQHNTGQRLVNSADVPVDLEIRDIFVKGETLNIIWSPDGHTSSFTWSWLREHCYSNISLERRANDMIPPSLQKDAPIPDIEYDHVMNSKQGLFEMLHQIVEHGFTVIRNTPSIEQEVKKIAERVAPVSHLFLYGEVFDVIAEPDPVNIAYTNQALKHHHDLAYYESPPGLQLLHALRFDANVTGGESTFVDTFAVAHTLRELYPDHFQTLCRVPATFKKHHLNRSNPAIMEYQRPHIQVNHRDEVIAMHWSPPFEGPLKVPFDDVVPYYAAYKVIHELIESHRFTIEFKLKQGDTVIFNQRRMLHGRKAFSMDVNSVRHLQGTYVNIDDALCRFNALRLRFAPDDPTIKNRRVGNGNYS